MQTKPNKHKINIITLGCSKNLVDSEVLVRQVEAGGLKISHNADSIDAETIVINTCGFINDAKQESIDMILQFAQAKQEGKIKKLYVIGCLSERYKEELKKEFADVDEFFGVNNLQEIVETLQIDYKKELLGERVLSTPAHYAYIKISEGCDKKCAFCAIPLIRGKYVSKPVDKLVNEVQLLVNKGVKEIMLIAQDLSYYGYDLDGKSHLAALLKKLSAITGLQWIRLHYAYPVNFPMEILDLMRSNTKITNYLDIPFQHISTQILRNMRRGNTRENTLSLIKTLREKVPDISLRTTLLVGFPGETETDFEELKDFVREFRFERLGVFTYSHEENTSAYEKYEDTVDEDVKTERANEIMELQAQISAELNAEKIGKTYRVIIDKKEDEYFIGRTEFDSPEVDNEVLISSEKELKIGEFYEVEIINADEFDLFGKLA